MKILIFQENRIESAKILLEAGSDPFVVSKYGDDILQTACLKGNLSIFNYLMETVNIQIQGLFLGPCHTRYFKLNIAIKNIAI